MVELTVIKIISHFEREPRDGRRVDDTLMRVYVDFFNGDYL